MPPNEAKAFQSLSRPNGCSHVRAIDAFWCIVIYSRTQTNINALDEILNLTGTRPLGHRAPGIEISSGDTTPGHGPRPITETSGQGAAVGPYPTTQFTVSLPVLLLSVAIAVLGGILAATVLSIGPIRKS